jgi:hypothetical protein
VSIEAGVADTLSTMSKRQKTSETNTQESMYSTADPADDEGMGIDSSCASAAVNDQDTSPQPSKPPLLSLYATTTTTTTTVIETRSHGDAEVAVPTRPSLDVCRHRLDSLNLFTLVSGVKFDEVVVANAYEPLTRGDFLKLSPGEWLNDSVSRTLSLLFHMVFG